MKGWIFMTSAQLKIFAIIVMLIDHMGYVLFPKVLFLRVIGRLAFPLFAFFIAEGYRKTRDITDYLGRLVLFALISQLPFIYAFNTKGLYLNVFFTLAMGLYAVYSYDKTKKITMVILIAAACQVINTDYGAYGVLLVFFFNRYHDNFKEMAKNVIFLTIAAQLIQAGITCATTPSAYVYRSLLFTLGIQPLCLLSLFLIKIYNGERGARLKYLFYAFYPVHLIILGMIRDFLK
jgi:hypothetical protein